MVDITRGPPKVTLGIVSHSGSASGLIRSMTPCDGVSTTLHVASLGGWTESINHIVASSSSPYVLLANDDTRIETPGWLNRLLEPFQADDRIAMVGPRTDTNCPQGRVPPTDRWIYVEPSLFSHPVTRERMGTIGHFPLSGFFALYSRTALDSVGPFDENLPGNKESFGGEDDDWQARAHLMGWRFACHPGVLVHHDLSTSIGNHKAEAQKKARAYLLEKWEGMKP